MIPPIVNAVTNTTDFVDARLGLAFHSDSAFLRGIASRTSAATMAGTNGAVIPARSENDTGNNLHNPMYAINKAGADGSLLTLIGSRNSDSGGNSMAAISMIDPEQLSTLRPTKVDRPSDVTGLVDTGELVKLLSQEDAVAVMESITRISNKKLDNISTKLASTRDAEIKKLVQCGYVKSADLIARFGDPTALNPSIDPQIVGRHLHPSRI
ncbi:MAG: twin-arginine translocation pathway signal protein [Halothiobacillaceae bacterium]|nr:MAG: twin-arginine translocation pathway signal protein [Halothiobacillaceae bacterium]